MSPLEFLPHEAIIAAPRKAREIAIEGVLSVGDLCVLTGGHDSFKSSLALEMAWSLATCSPWLKKFVVRYPLRMGVVQTEISAGSYDTRMHSYPTAAGDLWQCSDSGFTLDQLEDLAQAVEMYQLDGVVIDPLGDMWPERSETGEPFDENRKTHVAPLLRRFKRLGKTVILVHHDTKAGGRASGSSALLNSPDTRIFVDRLEPRESETVEVEVRCRLQHPTGRFHAKVEWGEWAKTRNQEMFRPMRMKWIVSPKFTQQQQRNGQNGGRNYAGGVDSW